MPASKVSGGYQLYAFLKGVEARRGLGSSQTPYIWYVKDVCERVHTSSFKVSFLFFFFFFLCHMKTCSLGVR